MGAKIRFGSQIASSLLHLPKQTLPLTPIDHLRQACTPQHIHRLPAAAAGPATEDHRLSQVADAVDIGLDPIRRDIQRPGDMSLVILIRRSKVDHDRTLLHSLPNAAATPET